MFIRDSSGKKSITATAFWISIVICNLKLALSGVKIGAVEFGVFDGSSYALALGAAGSIYALRKSKIIKEDVVEEKSRTIS